uniref:Zinc finger protein 436-like n=1 Tax=Erpetoichthys calabaricus TaxID=27687 RepID=A0A8C4T894_ERPCA
MMEETHPGNMKALEMRSVNIKEEDCVQEHLHPKPERCCVKSEDCEPGTVGIKEEPNEEPVIGDTQEYKIIDQLKEEEEEDLHSESVCLSGSRDGGFRGSVCPKSWNCLVQERAVSAKQDVNSDTKTSEETTRRGPAGPPSPTNPSVEDSKIHPPYPVTYIDMMEEMHPGNMKALEMRSVNIKEKDCERECLHPKPERRCVKSEDCEPGTVGIKEEPNEEPGIGDTQEYKIIDQLKEEEEEDLHSESVCQSGSRDGGFRGLACPESWNCLVQERSVSEKRDVNSDTKTSEETTRRRPAGPPSPTNPSVEGTKDGLRCSPSLSAESSLQVRPQQTLRDDNTKRMPSGSEMLMSSSLQLSSLPVVPVFFIINAPQPVNSTYSEALHVCQEQRKSLKPLQIEERNRRNYRSQRPYGCSVCGKRFFRKFNFEIHMRIHTGEKPFCCSECGKRFSDKGKLKYHETSHMGEKPYHCSECGKQFTRSSSLHRHKVTHTRGNLYCCSECGEGFPSRNSLESHTGIHTGKKLYCCSECGKGFSNRTSLAGHKGIHFRKIKQKQTHCCSECGKEFLRKVTLANHMRSHTGEKPYGCLECGKRFSVFSSLKRHMQTHARRRKIVKTTSVE